MAEYSYINGSEMKALASMSSPIGLLTFILFHSLYSCKGYQFHDGLSCFRFDHGLLVGVVFQAMVERSTLRLTQLCQV
jgi:hypothetical protein